MSWCKSVPCQIWSPDFGHLELQNKVILIRTDLVRETGQHVKFFVTFATKVPYLTLSDKWRQFLIKEMDREGGNKEKMRKCREWISLPFPHSLSISSSSLHFLSISSFSLHFLFISSFFISSFIQTIGFVDAWIKIFFFNVLLFAGSLNLRSFSRVSRES